MRLLWQIIKQWPWSRVLIVTLVNSKGKSHLYKVMELRLLIWISSSHLNIKGMHKWWILDLTHHRWTSSIIKEANIRIRTITTIRTMVQLVTFQEISTTDSSIMAIQTKIKGSILLNIHNNSSSIPNKSTTNKLSIKYSSSKPKNFSLKLLIWLLKQWQLQVSHLKVVEFFQWALITNLSTSWWMILRRVHFQLAKEIPDLTAITITKESNILITNTLTFLKREAIIILMMKYQLEGNITKM